jgi:hypothetical protein
MGSTYSTPNLNWCYLSHSANDHAIESNDPAKIQWTVESREIHPNVVDKERLFLQAISAQHLHSAVLTLHVMQVVMIDDLPTHQSVNPTVLLRSNLRTLVAKPLQLAR